MESLSAGEVVAAVAIAGLIVQKVVEWLKDTGLPSGTWTRLAALVLGIGFAVAADFQAVSATVGTEVAEWFDTVITGVGIGAGAGFFNEIQG